MTAQTTSTHIPHPSMLHAVLAPRRSRLSELVATAGSTNVVLTQMAFRVLAENHEFLLQAMCVIQCPFADEVDAELLLVTRKRLKRAIESVKASVQITGSLGTALTEAVEHCEASLRLSDQLLGLNA